VVFPDDKGHGIEFENLETTTEVIRDYLERCIKSYVFEHRYYDVTYWHQVFMDSVREIVAEHVGLWDWEVDFDHECAVINWTDAYICGYFTIGFLEIYDDLILNYFVGLDEESINISTIDNNGSCQHDCGEYKLFLTKQIREFLAEENHHD
jgi:hypothetical protein